MIMKAIVALFAVLCLSSCASMGSGMKVEGDTLSCSQPRLDIHFKKEVLYSKEHGNDGGMDIILEGDPRSVTIGLLKIPHSTKIDYFLSLREIASNSNFYYVGDTKFGGKEWAKIAYYDKESGNLICGYFTNIDNDFIFVSINALYVSRSEKDALMKYTKTMTMPAEGLAIIDQQLDYLAQVMEIK